MSSNNWQHLEELFFQLVNKKASEREAFIQELEKNEPETARELQKIYAADKVTELPGQMSVEMSALLLALDQNGRKEGFFDTTAPDSSSNTGKLHQIGPYQFLEKLGEGAMGWVYLAKDTSMGRLVALKVLREPFGIHGQGRFTNEYTALAKLQHPYVCHIYSVEQGDKFDFFTMEHVKGSTLERYCQQNKLTVVQRLKLFLLVCEAVDFIHQNGVIHRDLKPSNIMVTTDPVSHEPIPKILDFGIAKIIDHPGNRTRTGAFIGTPAYCSPQQASLTMKANHQCDVYALGVILYELIVGESYLDLTHLEDLSSERIIKAVCDAKPKKPSLHLKQSSTLNAIAADRNTTGAHLVSVVKGDLDCIVLHALERARKNRYQSAAQLKIDLEAFLIFNSPLFAPSTPYQVTINWLKRNARQSVLALTAVILILGSIGYITQTNHRTKKARNQADMLEAQHKSIEHVLLELLSAPNTNDNPNQIQVIDLLKRAGQEMDSLQNNSQARLELAKTLYSFGQFDLAAYHIRAFLKQEETPDLKKTRLHAVALLANSLTHMNRLDESKKITKELLDNFNEDNNDHALKYRVMADYARLLLLEEKPLQAEEIYKKALTAQVHRFGENHLDTAQTMVGLGNTYVSLRQFEKAETFLTRGLHIQKSIWPTYHPQMLATYKNMGHMFIEKGEYDNAKVWLNEALNRRREMLGQGPDTMRAQNSLVRLLIQKGEHLKAKPLAEQVFSWRLEYLGHNSPLTIQAKLHLSLIQHHLGNYHDAYEGQRLFNQLYLAAGGPIHRNYTQSLGNMGDTLIRLGRPAEAVQLLQQTLWLKRSILGERHLSTMISQCTLAEALQHLERYDEALCVYEQTLADADQFLEPNSHFTDQFKQYYLDCLNDAKAFDQLAALIVQEQRLSDH